LTGSDWRAASDCVTQAWYRLRGHPTTPDEASAFRAQQTDEIRCRARELWPDGVVAGHASAQLLADSETRVVFGARVEAAPFSVTVDILERGRGGWHVVTVHPSFDSPKKRREIVDAQAFAVLVLRRAGHEVAGCRALLLSRDYRYGEPTERLFERIDTTDVALTRADEIVAEAEHVASAALGPDRPGPKLGSACRRCPWLASDCLGHGVARTIFELPGLRGRVAAQLWGAGTVDLTNLPTDLALDPKQQRVRRAIESDRVIVEGNLRGALDTVVWPCHYLDFETVTTFLPLYEGHGCHRHVLTQFSVHRREAPGSGTQHREFLADAERDCEREAAIALIRALGDNGSVIVYSGFEQSRIEALIVRFPDLRTQLASLLTRLVDLERMIEAHVYHPDFSGSYSLKNVLPALAPDRSYAGMDVANGGAAIAQFARLARGEITGDAAATTRSSLLAYCAMDTQAMVRLHDVLLGLAATTESAAA
jgi:hypothetical protein